MIDVSIFYKLEKMSGQTVQLIKIKTVTLLYLIMVVLSSLQTFFCSFYYFGHIQSKKEITPSEASRIRQYGCEKNSANQKEK